MSNLNRVLLIGNLTRDPETRSLPNGNSVANFGIAINRRYTANGEKREETTFVDVESWGKQAELIAQYFTKGKPIFIEGRLKLDTWENKEGEKRSKMLVVLENFRFVNSGGGGDNAGEPNAEPAATAPGGGNNELF